jgi:hypothetical protein
MIPGPLYHQFPFWIELWALIMRRAMSVKCQSATSQPWLNTKEARQLRRPPFNQKQFSLFASLKWLTGPGAPSSGRTVQKSVVRDGVAQGGAQHSEPRHSRRWLGCGCRHEDKQHNQNDRHRNGKSFHSNPRVVAQEDSAIARP